MAIVFTLLAVIGLWFQYGLVAAAAGGLAVLPVLAYWSRGTALLLALLLLLMLSNLEFKARFALPAPLQHSTQSLVICIVQAPKFFADGWTTGYARVIEQPAKLRLRTVKFAFDTNKKAIVPGVGDCIHGDFRLRQPLGRLVPGAFNADRYNFAHHIDAYASLLNGTAYAARPSAAGQLYLNRQAHFASAEGLSLWAALLLGWSSSIDSDTKALLVNNQVVHLFVISGLHLGIIAAAIALLLKGLNRLLAHSWQLPHLSQGLLVVTVTFSYLWLLGFPLPALRAWLMLLLPLTAFYLRRQWSLSDQLAAAAIVLCLLVPEGWLSLGPWLSFWALLIICLLYRWRLLHALPWWLRPLLFQALLSVSILPWALLIGLPVNALSLFLNLIIGLFVVSLLMPLAVLISLFPAAALMSAWQLSIDGCLLLLRWGDAFSVQLGYQPLAVVVPMGLLVGFLLWERAQQALLCLLALVLVAVPIVAVSTREQASAVRVTLYDVGHGLALQLTTPAGNYLYDTGGLFNPELSVLEATLYRALRRLDGVIISHSDADHAAGFAYLRQQQPAIPAWSGQPQRLPLAATVRDCHAEPATINAFMRFIPIPRALRVNDNDSSCVLELNAFGQRMLVTGDASRQVEYYLMQEYPELLAADILLLGHHGSNTSSASDWLAAHVGALYLVSAGDRAAPRWPAPRIDQWFADRGEQLRSTARFGTLEIILTQQGYRLRHRQSAYRRRLIR